MTKLPTNLNIHSKGFTLVELIIVGAIIAVLASSVIFVFPGVQRGARDSRRKSDLKQYQTSLEKWANTHNGFYPYAGGAILTDATALCSAPYSIDSACSTTPSGTNTYRYSANGSGAAGAATATNFVLWAQLEKPNAAGQTLFFGICSTGVAGCTTTAPTTVNGTCPALTAC